MKKRTKYFIVVFTLAAALALLPAIASAAPSASVYVTPEIAEVISGETVTFTAHVSGSTYLAADDGWYVVHEEIADEDALMLGECAFRLNPAQSEYTYSYDWCYTEDYFGWDESSFQYHVSGVYLSLEDLDETIGEVGFFYQCTASDGNKCRSATYDASHFEYSGESRIRFVSEGGSYVAVSPSEASVAPGSPAVFNANVKVSGVHLEEDDGWYVVHEEIADEETLILGECAFRLDPSQSEYTYSYDWHYTEDYFGWDESSFRYAINGTRLTVSNLDDSISKVGFFYQCTGSHGHKYRSAAYSDDYYDYKYEGESTVRIVPEAPDASRVTLNWTSKPYNGSVQKPTVTVKNKAGYTVPEDVYYTVSYSAGSKNPGNYQVTVTGRDSFSGSVTKTYSILPGAVTNLKAAKVTDDKAALTWSAAAGAEMYMIYTSPTKDGTYSAYTYLSGTSYTVNRTNASKLFYKVRAFVTDNGTRVYGPFSAAAAVKSAPGQVTNLKAAKVTDDKATLTWNAAAGAEMYMIYTSPTKDGTYSAYTYLSGTSYTVNRTNAGKLFYKVRAFVTDNGTRLYGPFSAAAAAVKAAPGQVKNLKATIVNADQATLTWDAATGAEMYMIYTSSTENGTFSAYTYISGTSYAMNRTNAGKLFYKVRAFVTDNGTRIYGAASAAVRSTPGTVKNLNATIVNADKATLSWSAVAGAEKYMVYTSATKDGTYSAYTYISGTSYAMNRTNAGKLFYKVRAFVTDNGTRIYGAASAAARSTPGQVKNLKAVKVASDTAVLTWNEVPFAEKYMVYISASKNGTYTAYGITADTSYVMNRTNAGSLFYKVRAFVTDNGVKYHGPFSAAVQAK